MTAKERHYQSLIEFLGNPNNDIIPRAEMSTKILGFAFERQIYDYFTPDELDQLEKAALEIRRTKYSSLLAKVDTGIIKQAATGDSQAAKLAYQRFEEWSEKNIVHITFEDGLKELLDLLPPELRTQLLKKLAEKKGINASKLRI